MTVAVRLARSDDLDAWLALFDEVAGEGRWIGAETVHRSWAEPMFRRLLDSTSAAIFVAEADGVHLGDLHAEEVLGVVELGMKVRAGHRGIGIGSALVAACLDWARGRGAHKVVLSVFPHNEAAIALYRKHGFVVEGRQVRHWRRRDGELWDLVLMGLLLP